MKKRISASRTCIVCRDDEKIVERQADGETYDACEKCHGDRFRRAEAVRRAREKRGAVMIAALFVERNGVYWDLPGVDAWDAERDARLYAGPWSVVAHPPCHLWVNFAALNFKRYGGEHNRPGNDGGCFASALASVRKWGGVLEHPAHSNAWRQFSLTAPKGTGWIQAGPREWTCEVWQSAYGHRARKRTWLLYVGDVRPPDLNWSRNPGTAQCGWFDRIKPTLSKKEASRTPVLFRDTLIILARIASRKAD